MTRHPSLLALSSLLVTLAACGGTTDSELSSTSNTAGAAGSSAGGSAGTSAAGTSSAGTSSGGTSSGGTSSGGTSSGGTSSGGTSSGGSSTAGTSSGGTSSGGSSTAGTSSGGTSAAGTGSGGGEPGGAGGAPQVDCAPPTNPTKTAVCVSFAPEEIDFIADDPQLDGVGILYLAAYDTPFPDNGPGDADDAKPLAAAVYPPQSGQGETGPLGAAGTLRLDDLPETVYLRAFFFDNPESFKQKQVAWGVWVGGLELSGGLNDKIPLNKQAFEAGKGTPFKMPLSALRRLEVAVKLGPDAKPLDDGAGPFQWLAVDTPTLKEGMPLFGSSPKSCLSLSAVDETPVIRGFVLGAGTFSVLGILNDFNQPEGLHGGEILNVTSDPAGLTVNGAVTFEPKEYKKTHSIDLSFALPLPPGPKPPSFSCP